MKNNYRVEGNKVFIEIFCKKEKFETVIDLEDFEIVNSHEGKWYAWYSEGNDSHYVCGWKYKEDGKLTTFYLHRLLYENPKGLMIDHINHDTLNNTRENTRVVTASENQHNRKLKIITPTWDSFSNSWRARFIFRKKKYDLGRFKDYEDAKNAIIREKRKLGILN